MSFFDFLTCPHYDAGCIFETGTTTEKKKKSFKASQMKHLSNVKTFPS